MGFIPVLSVHISCRAAVVSFESGFVIRPFMKISIEDDLTCLRKE
jgi:hypothetical protein